MINVGSKVTVQTPGNFEFSGVVVEIDPGGIFGRNMVKVRPESDSIAAASRNEDDFDCWVEERDCKED